MVTPLKCFLLGALTVAALWFLHTWYQDRVLLYQMYQFLSAIHG